MKFGVNMDYALPLVGIQRPNNGPELTTGILKDLGEALSQEMGYKPHWILLPKKRVAPSLASGNVQILCHLNEVWQPAIKDDVWWSQDIYRSTNLIVYTTAKPVRSLADLNGERVGTVLNFIYQNLDSSFAKKTILREDGPNNESNIRKLLNGRLEYVIMSNLEFNYYKKLYPSLKETDLGMDNVMTKCAVSKKSKLSIDQVNRALSSLKKTGTIDKILRSY
ncbi:substrate-binding periplasmic protein [Bdellovibrio bacteriovorus]|uniref:substrate-binding periplasmic protein n=1 Tax=Bdellovibrio bacteriovorus TaxID=959 RepID=UPI0035A5C2D4